MIEDNPDVYAIGVVPLCPFVLWDYDLNEFDVPEIGLQILKDFALARGGTEFASVVLHHHFAIRVTKHGYHLVMACQSWDEAQAYLYELYKITNKRSIMSCRKQRLRISPKWHYRTGAIVSPAPMTIEGCEHRDTWLADITDRGRTRLEMYKTKDVGLDSGLTEKQWLALGEQDVNEKDIIDKVTARTFARDNWGVPND